MQQGYPIAYIDESGFESETIHPYGYTPIGSLVLIAITGKQKSVLTSLVRFMKKYCLRLIIFILELKFITYTPTVLIGLSAVSIIAGIVFTISGKIAIPKQ